MSNRNHLEVPAVLVSSAAVQVLPNGQVSIAFGDPIGEEGHVFHQRAVMSRGNAHALAMAITERLLDAAERLANQAAAIEPGKMNGAEVALRVPGGDAGHPGVPAGDQVKGPGEC